MKTALMMLSGGIDSTVALLHLLQTCRTTAVFFDFGQKSADFELTSARQICRQLGVPLEVVDISGLKYFFLGILPEPTIALGFTAGSRANCPHGLFGVAASYCISADIDVLATGMQLDDTQNLNNVRGYLGTWASAISSLQSRAFAFEFPLIDLPKAEVIKLGSQLNAPLHRTRSCSSHNELHCGVCDACNERKSAFQLAGVADPTNYLS